MLQRMMIVLAGATLAMAGVGCQNRVHDQNLAFHQQNRQLQERNRQLESELSQRPDAEQVGQLQLALAERDARIRQLQDQLRTQSTAPAAQMPNSPITPPLVLAGIETEFNNRNGEMTVRVPGDVLFDAGVATLKPGARQTLDRIAAALKKDFAGKAIRIEGHTDSDPLVKTRSQWQDNRNLSLARALAVTRYLESKGIDSGKLSTVGHGEHRPRGRDKSRNRRVEIVVVTR